MLKVDSRKRDTLSCKNIDDIMGRLVWLAVVVLVAAATTATRTGTRMKPGM